MTLSGMTRLFATASRTMAMRCGEPLLKDSKETTSARTYAVLGVEQVSAIRGRAVLMRPEKVNQVLHKMGVAIKTGEAKPTLNVKVSMPGYSRVLRAVGLPDQATQPRHQKLKGFYAQVAREKERQEASTVPSRGMKDVLKK